MGELDILDLPRLFGYEFFQNALVGGTVVALACALIGLFLILRKEAMIGDGIAHTAFGGIALGLYVGVFPLGMALVVAIISVLGISYMRRKGLAQSDSAIAVMLALGFSLGLIIVSLAGGFNIELFSVLFGSILSIDATDLAVVSVLGILTVAFVGVFYKELLSITFDEEASRLMGIPVSAMSVAFNVLVAVAIVLSIKVVGMILVVALLVLPGLTALQLDRSFRGTAVMSVVFAVLAVIIGICISAVYDVATSGVIVFTGAGMFLFTASYKRLG
jgi:zinc transport system permease protein